MTRKLHWMPILPILLLLVSTSSSLVLAFEDGLEADDVHIIEGGQDGAGGLLAAEPSEAEETESAPAAETTAAPSEDEEKGSGAATVAAAAAVGGAAAAGARLGLLQKFLRMGAPGILGMVAMGALIAGGVHYGARKIFNTDDSNWSTAGVMIGSQVGGTLGFLGASMMGLRSVPAAAAVTMAGAGALALLGHQIPKWLKKD